MIVEKVVNTTYGILEEVLFQLGFVAFYLNNSFGFPCVVHEHPANSAQISLPVRPKDDLMYGGHFLSAETVVDNCGIAEVEDFCQIVREVARKKIQAA